MRVDSSSNSSTAHSPRKPFGENLIVVGSPQLRRTRSGPRWRHTRTRTAVVAVLALLVSTTAWLSLIFSGTTTSCWHQFTHWEASRQGLHWISKRRFSPLPDSPESPAHSVSKYPTEYYNLSGNGDEKELLLKHIVFGIAGSSQLWKKRKEFVRMWWRPHEMRGYVWLEEQVVREDGDELLPPVMVSGDISRFRYTNPTGHPSGLRISRIATESYRLKLPHVRWFVLGDDDTIFNADNLVAVLSKYNAEEMVYIGSPSESHSANSYFSHSMAFGGGGIALSYPLAEALSVIHDDCIERYPKLYGSDDRLHACITELGVPLTKENGFHQWDIRGSAHGLLSSHPIAPFVSVHHIQAVEPFFPQLSFMEGLRLFTKAMKAQPMSFLQRSICYDHERRLTFSVSLGYVVQVYPEIVLPRELERSEQTYSAWNKIKNRNEFDFDIRPSTKSICKKPILFFLKRIERQENSTVGVYSKRVKRKDDLKRRVLCFPRQIPLLSVHDIEVLGIPPHKNWHLAPRRLCCSLNQTGEANLRISVRQCEKSAPSSV
uniref:Uncharacterized protein n=1 Tax=Kalanchoe fedtschenkoi TaxID=63787 RepID=A0A7N0T7F0_KALFE